MEASETAFFSLLLYTNTRDRKFVKSHNLSKSTFSQQIFSAPFLKLMATKKIRKQNSFFPPLFSCFWIRDPSSGMGKIRIQALE
jgi:hypothetical protein